MTQRKGLLIADRGLLNRRLRGCALQFSNPQSAISNSAAGLTLLEVILGLAIFVGALAVISKLVEYGVHFAEYAQLETRAVMLAESKLGEILAGVVTLDSAGGDTFSEDPAWQWSLTYSDGPVEGLKWVSMTVYPSTNGELAKRPERIEFTLSRWLFDPSYAAELDAAAAADAAASTSTTDDAASTESAQ